MKRLIFVLACVTAVLAASVQPRAANCVAGSITSNGRNCTVACGIDHLGGDYSSLYTADWPTCMNACTADPICATAQYSLKNSYCYLKNTTNPSSNNYYINSIVCIAPTSPQPIPASQDDCTAGNVVLNGRAGVVQCGFDYPGGDYSVEYTGSFAGCQSLCAADSNCSTAQYNSNTRYCYLKSFINIKASVQNWIIYSIVFPPATTAPSGCMPYTPFSPYMQSPGFEQGLLGWWAPSPGDSYGNFTSSVTNGIALEGCNAFLVNTAPNNNAQITRYIASEIGFAGTEYVGTYNISLKVGRIASTIAPGTAPLLQVQLLGQTPIYTHVCGWSNSGPCPIQGIGGARGQLVTGQFSGSGTNPRLTIYIYWLAGTANNNPVLLDDVQITPA